MRIILLILIFLCLFFGEKPVFAANVDAPTLSQSMVQLDQPFSINSNLTSVQPGDIYFVKCRIGPSSSSLTEGQTYNQTTANWLFDTDSWKDMTTVTATDTTTSFSIQCKVKSNAIEGQKIIYTRACLKKSDGTCGTSFQSSTGTNFTAVTPTPSLSPTLIPTATPTPTSPNPPNSPIPSSFTILNIPSQINSDQSFKVSINLSSPDNPNTKFYLKGAFKKSDSSNYFGLTKVSESWIKNASTYSNQFPLAIDSSGNWSGDLEIKPDTEDSGFTGTGDYIFKVGKYNSQDTNPTVSWSDESTIKIISTDSDQGDNTPIKSSSPTINPTTKSAPVKIKTTTSPQPKSYDRLVYHIASVAGASASATVSATVASESAKVEVKNQRQMNPLIWIGLIFIFAGAGSISYIYLIKKRR